MTYNLYNHYSSQPDLLVELEFLSEIDARMCVCFFAVHLLLMENIMHQLRYGRFQQK